MSAIQLTFSLRTSPGCKTVHLLGNWDNYRGQLPLSKDSSSSKSGAWRGSFKFSGNSLQQGQRYWYYYIIDGYHPSHDPAQPSTTEPTTKRQLNILDIPTSSSSSTSTRTRDRHGGPSLSLNTRGATSSSSSRYTSTTRAPPGGSNRKSSHSPPRHSKSSSSYGIPAQGRSLSPSNIVHPRPQKPHATRGITTARYSQRDMDALTRHMSRTHVSASSFSEDSGSSISDSESDSEIDSDYSADSSLDRRRVPSLSSGSSSPRSRGSRSGSGSGSSSPGSSLASPITPRSPAGSPCVCDRWGRDRRGKKVRMECGGKSCGSGSDLSSDSDGRGSAGYKTRVVGRGGGGEKRLGYVMRAGGVSRR